MKHTVYQSGGYDFRPHYALVGKIIHHFNSATVLALTATAPPQLETDLSLHFITQIKCSSKSMNRENISLQHFYNFNDDEGKIEWLLPFLSNSGPTIIYVSSKKMFRTSSNDL